MDADSRICDADEVPEESTLLFAFEDRGLEREGVLTRLGDGTVVGYHNECPHWTDVRLDRGDGALVRGDELVCRKHGATFEKGDGRCDFGPCRGATLPSLGVTVVDGGVYLADEEKTVSDLEAAETVATDLSSGGRIDF